MIKQVAISIKSMDGRDSLIDPRFVRAHAFIIINLNTGIVAQFFNSAASASHGAGTAAAIAMKSNDVDAVISGSFGPKALQSLEAFDIEMWIAPEKVTVKEVLKRFTAGELEQMKMKVY